MFFIVISDLARAGVSVSSSMLASVVFPELPGLTLFTLSLHTVNTWSHWVPSVGGCCCCCCFSARTCRFSADLRFFSCVSPSFRICCHLDFILVILGTCTAQREVVFFIYFLLLSFHSNSQHLGAAILEEVEIHWWSSSWSVSDRERLIISCNT